MRRHWGIVIFALGLCGFAEGQTLHKLPLFGAVPAVQAQAPVNPGQTAQPQAERAQPGPSPSKLNINVIEGAGAVNNIRTRAPHELTVEVDDENDRPIAGVVVTFFAPNEGAGGSFAGDTQLLTVLTDKDGRAVASSYRPNGTVGDYKIQVTVAYNDQTATTSISQSNQAPPVTAAKSKSNKKVLLIVAAAAAVAVGAGAGLAGGHGSNSSSSSSSSTTTASLGLGSGVTVGAPH
jgi:5-hydroxyisourate hydrolase-like protein (transthyretin family)